MGSLAPSRLLLLLLLLLFTLFTFIATISSAESIPNPIQDDIDLPPLPPIDVCSLVNCGQGKCKPSNDSSHSIYVPYIGYVGFDCDCNPGWKEIQIGNFTYPSCVIPDCTINLGCNSFPSQPAQSSPPSLAPQCGLVWCGDGTCIADETKGYICQCNEGSLNLFDNPQFACLKTCSIGGDCKKLGLSSGSPGLLIKFSRNLDAVTMILLTSIFLTWI